MSLVTQDLFHAHECVCVANNQSAQVNVRPTYPDGKTTVSLIVLMEETSHYLLQVLQHLHLHLKYDF